MLAHYLALLISLYTERLSWSERLFFDFPLNSWRMYVEAIWNLYVQAVKSVTIDSYEGEKENKEGNSLIQTQREEDTQFRTSGH